MKTYQTPEILWQEIDLADILTTSGVPSGGTQFNALGSDSELEIVWWNEA